MKQKKINLGFLLLFVLSSSLLSAQFSTNDWYAFEFAENGIPKVNLNGKIYSRSAGLNISGQNYIFASYNTQDSSYCINVNGTKQGPYRIIIQQPLITSTGKYMFAYRSDGNYFVNIDSTIYGPYIYLLWVKNKYYGLYDYKGITDNGRFYFTYLSNDRVWTLNLDGKKEVPLIVTDSNEVCVFKVLRGESDDYIFSGSRECNNDVNLLNINGKIYTGELDVDNDYNDSPLRRYMSADIEMSGKRYKYINGKMYGPYDTVSRIDYNSKSDFIFIITRDGNKYVNLNGREKGPYKDISDIKFFSDRNYAYKTKTSDGKYILNISGVEYGPYEEVNNYFLDQEGNYVLCYKLNGNLALKTPLLAIEGESANVLEHVSDVFTDTYGNLLVVFRYEYENVFVLYRPFKGENSVYGPYKYVDIPMLINGRYMFLYDRKYIMKDGKITELPEKEYGIFNKFRILENGNYGLLLKTEDNNLELLIVNGEVIKYGSISEAFITESGRVLYVHSQDGKRYVNINGIDYQIADEKLFTGTDWKELQYSHEQ